MQSPYSLRRSRRGFTLAELSVASSLTIVLVAGMALLLSSAGRIQLRTQLRIDSSQTAAVAMGNVVLDLREASGVVIPAAHQLRILYPDVDAAGHYDRFRTDTTRYVLYERADEAGTASPSGTCLWRKDQTGAGRILCRYITAFSAAAITTSEVRVSVRVARVNGADTSVTNLSQRVVFLRNQPN